MCKHATLTNHPGASLSATSESTEHQKLGQREPRRSQPRIDLYRSKYLSAMRSTVKRADAAARHTARSISPTRPIAATAASTLSTRKPVTPLSISSGIDPRLKEMTGVPQASDSTTDNPHGS